MDTFEGGVDPNTKVGILVAKKAASKKLSALKPSDPLGQVGSRWYFPTGEVRISKRNHTGYQITLETGESVLMAEGTITCGQYGPNLVEDCKDKLICFVIMNSFADSTDSRRNFAVEIKGGGQYKKLIASICKGGAFGEKKFYRFSAVLKFVNKLTEDHPEMEIVPCLQVRAHHQEGAYDFAHCVKPYTPFIPLIKMQDLAKGWNAKPVLPTVMAYCDDDYQITTRKVTSCRKLTSDGPWAMPVFRGDHSYSTTRQRFSWSANKFPIFNQIASHVSEWAAEVTQARTGQKLFPPPPPKTDFRFYSLGKSYQTLCSQFESEANAGDHSEVNLDELWVTLQKLAQAGISEATIKKFLITKIKEAVETTTSE